MDPIANDSLRHTIESADLALNELSRRAERQFEELSRVFSRVFVAPAERDLARLTESAAQLLVQLIEVQSRGRGIGFEKSGLRQSDGQALADLAAALTRAQRNL